MKKIVLGVLIMPVVLLSITFAAENTEIIDKINEWQPEALTAADLELQSFSSCDDMSSTLTDFVKENFDLRQGWPMPYWRWGWMIDDMAVREESMTDWVNAWSDADSSKSFAPAPTASSTTDFSTTNLQIAGVDEPEILKTDGEYIYYYNQRLQKILIVRGPLNIAQSTLSLANTQVVATIAVPNLFSNVQLFLREEQLVIVTQRRSDQPMQRGWLDTSSKTNVIVYDIIDPKTPKLMKFADLDGRYQDARVVNDTLYVVSQLWINRWWYGQEFVTADAVKVNAEDLLPRVIDIAYTKDADQKNLTVAWKAYPYHVSKKVAWCDETLFVLPSKKSIQEYGLSPQFTILRAIDLNDQEAEVWTTALFWSTQTIHLNAQSAYLANSFWAPSNSRCPAWAMCIRAWWGEQQTLLHKIALAWKKMSYVNSALLPWSPLTQWSMDEDKEWNFRILTTTRQPQQATHLITLDKQLNKLGSLLNIEPGEQFKASRFMGDKLYLVTFEQIDPLFVVDLASVSTPKIIGELKIPGYSTYLHPWAPEVNGVQRLVGLGYDTATNQRWWTQNAWIKLDLYKIDYTKKDAEGNIAVTQEQTATFGGKWSETEALQNPRLFVWNPTTKQVVMPMVLQDSSAGKQCTTTYDNDWKVTGEECRDNEIYKTIFAWMKAIEILPSGIKEMASYDYTDRLKADKQTYDVYQGQIRPRQLSNLQFRAWYLGDALYTINNLFMHVVVPGKVDQEVFVDLK
jgi:uncharacterized secreted protein with C-terminal beta-propeller domain